MLFKDIILHQMKKKHSRLSSVYIGAVYLLETSPLACSYLKTPKVTATTTKSKMLHPNSEYWKALRSIFISFPARADTPSERVVNIIMFIIWPSVKCRPNSWGIESITGKTMAVLMPKSMDVR
jgi:hypothetical protein